MWDEPLCSTWFAVVFNLDAIFAQSISYWWIMNTNFNCGDWGLEFFRCISGFFCGLHVMWMSSWRNFDRPVTTRKVHHCSIFFKFLDNSSHSESLEYQHFRNGFVTAPAVIKLFVWWSETIWQICKNIRDQEKDHFSEHCMFMPSPLVICG